MQAARKAFDEGPWGRMTASERVRTGTIGINGYLPDPGAPFGGVGATAFAGRGRPARPPRRPDVCMMEA